MVMKKVKPQSESVSGSRLDLDDSNAEQVDKELSANEESDPEVSGAEQSDQEHSEAENSGREPSDEDEDLSGAEESDPEESGAEESDPEQSGAVDAAEKSSSQYRPATPPRLNKLLSSEDIAEGTMAERNREFLSRIAAFTERIYKPDGRVNYCKICNKVYTTDRSFTVHMGTMHCKKKFQCKNCDKTFGMPALLRRHQKFFCDEATKCDLCRKVFTSTAELQEHKLVHYKRAVKCETCGKGFSTKLTLKTHQKMHLSEKPFVCTEEGCEERFQSNRLRDNHLDKVHQTAGRHTCTVCNSKFRTYVMLRRHCHAQHPKKKGMFRKPFEYLCPECGKKIFSRQSVKLHQMRHAKGLPVLFPRDCTCKVCSEIFPTRKALVRHTRTLHNTIKCPACDLKFDSVQSVGRHCVRTHSIYRCGASGCEAQLRSKLEKKEHRFNVHGLKTKSSGEYVCTFCNMKMKKLTELESHLISVHSVYQCNKCEQEFSSLEEKNTHFKKEHTRIHVKSSWTCNYCSQVFSTYPRYENHVKCMHKGFKCRDCNIVLSNQYSFKKHRRLMHPNPQPTFPVIVKVYQCSNCPSVFKSLHEKRRHRKAVHPRPVTASASYSDGNTAARCKPMIVQTSGHQKCHVCGRSCATEWHLSEHMKTHQS